MKRYSPRVATMVAVAGIALLASSCSNEPTTPRQGQPLAPLYKVDAPSRATDRYIVVLSDTVADVRQTAKRLALRHRGRIRHVYEYVLHAFSIKLPAQAVEVLRADPAVRYIQQVEAGKSRLGDHTYQLNAPWALDRIDQRTSLNSWYSYSETGSGVRAYVIDAGIRTAHTQFGGRASIGFNANPQDGTNGQDCNGHGTHVAAIIGGSTYGVAKSATLIGVKVNAGCVDTVDPDDEIAGINWVAGNHINPAVANMSIWGPTDTLIDKAVSDAVALGVTFVVIAGNANGDVACNYSPARVSQAITVAATNSLDLRASVSNVGVCVDIFAPGENILSAWATSNTATQTLTGTSQAAPHVTGAVARYLQFRSTATPADVASAILSRATPGVLSDVGNGSPNLLLYTRFVEASVALPTIPSCGTYTWTATGSGLGSSFTYVWETWVDSPFPPYYGFWTQAGTGPSYTTNVCPGNSQFHLRATATNEFGQHGSAYVNGT